mmetsp:Transcript_30309/g.59571  ORF Transcript_30309/g.59571 Transcript_30309/m.59571 type:complete len:103 (-) Transcript_30309:364-672(-)
MDGWIVERENRKAREREKRKDKEKEEEKPGLSIRRRKGGEGSRKGCFGPVSRHSPYKRTHKIHTDGKASQRQLAFLSSLSPSKRRTMVGVTVLLPSSVSALR